MLTLFLQANLYNALPIIYGDWACSHRGDGRARGHARSLPRYPYPIGAIASGSTTGAS